MELFHYHWWTDKVEEMESFYSRLGYKVTLRVGRNNGDMETFNPPLTWDDFRGKGIAFRIIEMRKGKTNITFGQGKRDIFDHIGILVDETEYQTIVQRAKDMNWNVTEGERRTFIGTPWKFRIELQQRTDVLTEEEGTVIKAFTIALPFTENPQVLANLLGAEIGTPTNGQLTITAPKWQIICIETDAVDLTSVAFISKEKIQTIDPVNTKLTAL